jgi:hypothetical protein
VCSEAELDFALNTFNKGELTDNELDLAHQCKMDDKFWLNPTNWGIE